MEELQQEVIAVELHQGRAGGMGKDGIGAVDDLPEFIVVERVADEGPHDAIRRLFVAQPAQGGDLGLVQVRDRLRNVEPPVPGKPGQHRLFEAQRGRLPAGRDVFHAALPSGLRMR